ncbi:M23 family metallopeptidase [Bifidobacterium amazonense]|uniref:M23 family metallopeptidase n=1 Tax=Bifidobacterium amazonense TaxID=2809027 RepID=A0ABS9VXX3_9BIFI|nr:M23 family metallopeptidase [Bifidobacterium amazonense]MCH9276953.1 M23 family metallopeptidase [Bifidobacterium amazonense]
MNETDEDRWLRRRRHVQDGMREREMEDRRRLRRWIGLAAGAMLSLCLTAVMCAMPCADSGLLPCGTAYADDGAAGAAGCSADMVWPVRDVDVTAVFDGPAQPWMAGHRGVDLAAGAGTTLLAPADGVIAFAGKVGGKSVVSIRHGPLTSTFEPAITDLRVGASVSRGEPFGQTGGASDHCDDSCVHWGVKRGSDDYEDPQTKTSARRIALKPTV